ncbi:hypothetical protein PR202_ga12937 [Eleusine coracana subsp. coracana]|uniref:F-box domain-containing protein n=1 Tax=Eleusine coracana subsp. coracana TaxID=191504 RepID=A0AAV5CDF0_ELECO|nr:hypothetical protein PR202_ga12937 [Eleusine coracana subsp. coracana]
MEEQDLANVLRRLAPHDLAKSRCVSQAWHNIIDDHRLLLSHLLPHKVGGIFIKFHNKSSWELFSRPSTGPIISSWFNFLPDGVEDKS